MLYNKMKRKKQTGSFAGRNGSLKHPALTRMFSVVLVVLCLTMLLAGLGSVLGALRDRDKGMADYGRLSGRIEEYEQVLGELEGHASYREANEALRAELEEHDDQAAQHRMDLAIYTATRGGLRAGAAALDQAEQAFQQGMAQYYEGIALFEEQERAFWEGYEQFQQGKRQLEEARKTMDLAESAMAGLRAQLNQSRAMAAILESEDEDARRELTIAAYDQLLSSLDGAVGLYEQLQEQGGVSPEQMEQLIAMLSEQSGTDLSWLEGVAWEGISAESLAELESRVAAATGMTVPEIRARIQQQRDAVADMDADAPITEEQFEALQEAYRQSREWSQQVDAAMEAQLAEYEAQLAQARAQLDEAQAQIDALEPMMEQGRAMMEQARAALDSAEGQIQMGRSGIYNGRRQINEQYAQLEEQQEELLREKEELDAEAERLADESAALDLQHEREQRETSLRLMLLDREEIQTRVDEGMELLPAAKDWAETLLRDTERMTNGRLWVAALMVLGGICGFAGVPAAFEKTDKRFWLVAPVLGALLCALGAEALCRALGRGDSYSALAVAIFAMIQLALVLPKKKKKA